MDRENQINFERNEIADIIASSFDSNGETWDAYDFEWSAHCVQMAGYRKQSEVANEIFDEIKAIIDSNTYKVHVPNSPFWSTEYKIKKIISEIGELKKKYVEENIK